MAKITLSYLRFKVGECDLLSSLIVLSFILDVNLFNTSSILFLLELVLSGVESPLRPLFVPHTELCSLLLCMVLLLFKCKLKALSAGDSKLECFLFL